MTNLSSDTFIVSRDAVRIQQFRLEVTHGPETGKVVLSQGQELTIGAARGNDLQLTDPAVSRHHCVLRVSENGLAIWDLDSTNGTMIDGVSVGSAEVRPGSVICVGKSRISVAPSGAVIEGELSERRAFGPVIGTSHGMRRLFAALERLANTNATVLLEGESGTGKGLVASALHDASARAQGPFVVVDCAATPGAQLEAELFGHDKGAFPGADTSRAGLFERAHGGTVFLDEIGELSLALQSKLLRVVEVGNTRPIGGTVTVDLDVRIITATSRDLRKQVNNEQFRSDLWYRLNAVRLTLPPLMERRQDIPLLVAHFYRICRGDPEVSAPAKLVDAMMRRRFTGNVRELQAVVERTVLLGSPDAWQSATDSRDASVTLAAFDPEEAFRVAKMRVVAAWEHAYLQRAIDHHNGNISRTAQSLRIDRNHLRRIMNLRGVQIRKK